MSKKALIIGSVWGLIAPFIGIFFGLQVSTTVGNLLAFPVIGLVYITGQPFGTWGVGYMVLAVTVSIVIWAILFGLVATLFKRQSSDAPTTPTGSAM